MELTQQAIPLRWSSISMFAKCQRRYRLGYLEHLIRKPGPESRARILGTHVHEGIAAALRLSFREPGSTVRQLCDAAVAASRKYNRENTVQGMTFFDYESKSEKTDVAYYEMMADVVIQANNILNYQVPRLGIGTRYRVASVGEVLFGENPVSDDFDVTAPFVEWNFHLPVYWSSAAGFDGSYEYDLTGTVDAVLYDNEAKEYFVFDWKTRKQLPEDRLIDLDGQLKYYAAIINVIAARSGLKGRIARSCQLNMLTSTPKTVTLTEKKKEVSRSVGSTTWEVWAPSVRALGLNPDDYIDLKEKMWEPDHFTHYVWTPVTAISSRAILHNVLSWGEAIRIGMTNGSFPALPSHTGCQYCDFKSYCSTLDNGGDLNYTLSQDYTHGDPDTDEEFTDEQE